MAIKTTKSTKSTLSVILTFSLCLITSTSTLHTALSPFDQQSYGSTPTLSPENLEQQQKEKKRRNKKNQKTKAKKEQSNQNPAIINIPTDGQRDPTNLAAWHRKKEKEYQQGLRQVKLSNELIEQSRGQGPEYDSVFREKLLDIYFPESDEDTQPGSPQRESGQPDDPPLGENDQLLFPEPNHESQEAQKLWQKKQLDEITAEADEFLENFSTTPPSLQEQPECPPRYRSDTKQKNPSKSAPPYTGTQQYLEDPHFWTPDMVNWVKNSIHSSSSTGTVQQPASSTSQISCYSCKKKKAHSKCGKCKNAYYCSAECQKHDWSLHKLTCKNTIAKQAKKQVLKPTASHSTIENLEQTPCQQEPPTQKEKTLEYVQQEQLRQKLIEHNLEQEQKEIKEKQDNSALLVFAMQNLHKEPKNTVYRRIFISLFMKQGYQLYGTDLVHASLLKNLFEQHIMQNTTKHKADLKRAIQLTQAIKTYLENNSQKNRNILESLKKQWASIEYDTLEEKETEAILTAKANQALKIPPKPNTCCYSCEKENANIKCQKCKNAYYCSIECKKNDWSSHKLTCKNTNAKQVEKQVLEPTISHSTIEEQRLHQLTDITQTEKNLTQLETLLKQEQKELLKQKQKDQELERQERDNREKQDKSALLVTAMQNLHTEPENSVHLVTFKELYMRLGYQLYGTDLAHASLLKNLVERYKLLHQPNRPERLKQPLPLSNHTSDTTNKKNNGGKQKNNNKAAKNKPPRPQPSSIRKPLKKEKTVPLPQPDNYDPAVTALFRGYVPPTPSPTPFMAEDEAENGSPKEKVNVLRTQLDEELQKIAYGDGHLFIRKHARKHHQPGDPRYLNLEAKNKYENGCYKIDKTSFYPANFSPQELNRRLASGIQDCITYTDKKGNTVLIGTLPQYPGDAGGLALHRIHFKAIVKKGIIVTHFPIPEKTFNAECVIAQKSASL